MESQSGPSGGSSVGLAARLLNGVRASLAVAIFASAALVIDYQNPGDPAFCGVESNCFKIRTSDLGKEIARKLDSLVPGLHLPTLALLLFVAMLAASFFLKGRLHARLFGGAMAFGGLFAAFLIYQQQRIGIFCAYCMVVDTATILGAALAVPLALRVDDRKNDAGENAMLAPACSPGSVIAWGVGVALITVTPFVWARFPENPPLPAPIAALQEPGKTVIVSFTDFQCPYCRRLHPVIHGLEAQPDVVVKRFMIPLDFHPGAMPAALAYKCVPEDKRAAMVDALYTADPKELTYEGVVGIAAGVGFDDGPGLRRCMSLKETKDAIDEEKLVFYDELGGQGVPMTWVGKTLVKGAREDGIIGAYNRASGPGFSLPTWSMFVAGALALLGVLSASERAARAYARATAAKPTTSKADEEPAEESRDEAGE